MTAFFKKNGAWILLAVIMLALLVALPYIEVNLRTGVIFSIYLENHASIGIDGIRLNWTVGNQEGVTDALNRTDLVKSLLKPGKQMRIDFTDQMLNRKHRFPEQFHADVAVLDALNFTVHEIVVEGTMDLEVDEEGEYVFYLEGSPGNYSIHRAEG